MCMALYSSMCIVAAEKHSLLVSFNGDVGYRSTPAQKWQIAQDDQVLAAGSQIKTAAVSSANILFPDGTQIKLAESSELTIRAAKPRSKKALSSTDLLLSRGKLWGRAKDQPDQLSVSTPTATAAVRGTEWEIDASAPDTSSVTVLNGEVELSNPQGSVVLNRDMRGTAKVGQKPSASRINRARDRVQWVSDYRSFPALYISQYAVPSSATASEEIADGRCQQLATPADGQSSVARLSEALPSLQRCALGAMLQGKTKRAFDLLQRYPMLASSWLGVQIQADLAAISGDYARVVNLFDEFGQIPESRPDLSAQRAAIDLHFGYLDKLQEYLQSTAYNGGQSPLKNWVAGDYYSLQGDFNRAETAFKAGLDMDATRAGSLVRLAKLHRAYGNTLASEDFLGAALALNPDNHFARSQQAELQLAQSQYGVAIDAFETLLTEKPDDLLALNSLAEAYLAQNRLDAAMQSAKKAGVVEPASALPNLTAGLIRHQRGNLAGAYSELFDAVEKDPNDPMPLLLMSAISADEYRVDEAMGFSKIALEKIPYLKSLDKVSSDQNGSSNIGNAYSKFGLEDFAKLYALDSYQPSWAGSQFFLAEREADSFVRSSLSLKGFINEPTTFGASKRRISLMDRSNISTEITYDRSGESGIQSDDYRMAVSGLTFSPVPISFFMQKTKGGTSDDGYGEEFSDTFSSIGATYSQFITGETISDAKMGSAWQRQVSRADKDISTLGLGIKPTSRLSLFALYVKSKESSPSSRISPDPSKIGSANDYLAAEDFGSELTLSEALRIFPLVDETTEGRYLNKLFIAGFKYQVTDYLAVLGKHSRTSSSSDVSYQDTTICQLSTLTNQSVGLELQQNLLPIYQEIGFLNNFYSPQNPNARPASFWDLYNQALKRDFSSDCSLSAFTDKSLQTELAGYDRKLNTLRDYSLALELTRPSYDLSIAYERSKSRDRSDWGYTGTDSNHYLDSAQRLTSDYASLPGINFFCGVSPIQSPLCQTVLGTPNALFSQILGTENFSEQIAFHGQDAMQSEYANLNVKYKFSPKAVLDIALQGVKSEANFYKRYQDTAVDYLYGGFNMFFPGAELSNIDGDTVSIDAPQRSLTNPRGPGWRYKASASLLLKPRDGVYLNMGHTDYVKPNLNVTLAPVYLGFSANLPYRISSDDRVSTDRLGVTWVTSDDALYRLSFSQSKITSEKISDNSGWGGSYITPSTKGYTEWLTSDVFDQMRSNNLRSLNTVVGPFEDHLCINCRRNTQMEMAANFVITPEVSASFTYLHHWNSKVVALGSSGFLTGALECFDAVLSDAACEQPKEAVYEAQAFPRHYIKTGITWLPRANLEVSLLVEHASMTESVARGVASVTDSNQSSIVVSRSQAWTDAHAMLRWRSKNRQFKVEAMLNGMFSEKYPANFIVRSSFNF